MYIARQVVTGATLQEIGREFGGRHHTTVLHSIRKIEDMCRSDGALDLAISRLMDAITLRLADTPLRQTQQQCDSSECASD
jgi:chromosomal replication initiator protein